jgi:hypothetical protein
MAHACLQCGCDLGHRHRAKYCSTCSGKRQHPSFRIGAVGRKRNVPHAPIKRDGQWCCYDCGEPLPPSRIGARNTRPPVRCDECGVERRIYLDVLSGRSLAAVAVSRARREGTLPSPRDFACADCGRPAECYDHRDYSRPLHVEPVCLSCNVLRGPAEPVNQFLVGLALLAMAQQQVAEAA